MPHASVEDIELDLLLEAVYRRYSHDFRGYARASLRRRVECALTSFGLPTVAELQGLLLREPDSFRKFLEQVTVPVTEMFRDPEYFAELRNGVLPHLATYPTLKIWVAGCSTGQEAYSIAILLAEAGLLERALVYATDINPASLAQAQSGIYRIEEMQKYTANYQKSGGLRPFSDYYTAAYGGAALDPALKRKILFTEHSLATDQVFSEVQLVSCRNVLIYFDRQLQNRAFGLFHESLANGGFLGLGEKENLRFSSHYERFIGFNEERRIYRKVYG